MEVVAVDCRPGLVGDVLLRSGAIVADIAFPLCGRIDRLRRARVRRGRKAVDLRDGNIWRRHFSVLRTRRRRVPQWMVDMVGRGGGQSMAVCSRWRVREKRWALCSGASSKNLVNTAAHGQDRKSSNPPHASKEMCCRLQYTHPSRHTRFWNGLFFSSIVIAKGEEGGCRCSG